MTKVAVTIAYGNPEFSEQVQGLAREIGGADVKIDVPPHNVRVFAEFATEEQAEKFRNAVKQRMNSRAYNSTPERP